MCFEELITKISPKLKGITHKLNGRFSFFDEDDLYQEALIHLWLAYQAGKLGNKTDSYILQGCYFHLKNYIRKVQDKACLISIDSLIKEKEDLELEEVLPLGNFKSSNDNSNRKVLLEEILDNGSLSKREKEIFSLGLKGWTTREIGKRLGISHVRVVKIKNKIKSQKIRAFLKGLPK